MATPDSLNCPETGNRCPATFPVVVRDAPLGPVGPPCLTGEVTPCGGPSPSLDECLGILPVAVYPQASVLAVLGDPQVDGARRDSTFIVPSYGKIVFCYGAWALVSYQRIAAKSVHSRRMHAVRPG